MKVELHGIGKSGHKLTADSDDPAVVVGLIEVLRSVQATMMCRCAALGSMEFRRPDGTTEHVLIMPAHDIDSVEFRVMGRGRYRVNREWFLRTVAPLGITAERWYKFPDTEND